MAGENERVKDNTSASTEAKNDADAIKKAGSPDESYKRFKQEIDDLEKNVTDKSLREQYRNELTKAMGSDLNVMLVQYLKDPENGGKLKDATTGEITARSVDTKAVALATGKRDGSELDKLMLPELSISFDEIRNANKNDRGSFNSENITSRDLDSFLSSHESNVKKKAAVESNKQSGYADVLLDPNNSRAFTDAEKSFWSGEDGRMSQSNIDNFVAEAEKYQGPDKEGLYPAKFVEKLKQISANWNSEEVNTLKDANGYLTRDSIASGSGYDSYADFLAKRQSAPKSSEVVGKESFELVTYNDSIRTFKINEQKQLVSFTETKNGVTSEYKVDDKGQVTDKSGNLVGSGANFNMETKQFSLNGNIESPKGDDNKNKVVENVTSNPIKYQDSERVFTVSKDGKLLSFTEKVGENKVDYTVDEKGNVREKGKDEIVRTNASLDLKTNQFTFEMGGKKIESAPITSEQPLQAKNADEKRALYTVSTQKSGQGYWQVAENMLANSLPKGKDENSQDLQAQKVVLMRALQKQVAIKDLGNHQFIKDEQSVTKLIASVEEYAKANPQFKKTADKLVAKLKPYELKTA